ncbi:hypothetical protein B0H19DRAFT_1274028 [Mycena capillaripes]|nr:hypothetical protein B0H19DRAFT_1274028 [Mycena capillaripes]
MPFSRLRLFYLDILALLDADRLRARDVFSQHSARELRQFLIESADLCSHLRISRVEYFGRNKAVNPAFVRLSFTEVSVPEISNYLILGSLDVPQPNASDVEAEKMKFNQKTDIIYVSRRRRPRLPRFQPGNFTRIAGLDSALQSTFSVANVVVLAAWLFEDVPDSMGIENASSIWTNLLPAMIGVAPHKIQELQSRLQASHSDHLFSEDKSRAAEVERLHRSYDIAWNDFKACINEQNALKEMSPEAQLRARELIEMRRKTREAAEIRIKQHAKGQK